MLKMFRRIPMAIAISKILTPTLAIIAGSGGILLTSTNGTSWTQKSTYVSDSIYSTAFGNNKFIIGTNTGKIKISNDGLSWGSSIVQVFEPSATYVIRGLAYGAGVWVAGTVYGLIKYSVDGITWTTANSGINSQINSISFINDKFYACCADNNIIYSADGITWTKAIMPATSYIVRKIAYGNGKYLAACNGGNVLTSNDGITWTLLRKLSDYDNNSIIYDNKNNRFIIGTAEGGIFYSSNGISFIKAGIYFDNGRAIYDIISFNGIYVFVGGNGVIQTTTDFLSMTWRNSNTLQTLLTSTTN